MEVSPWSVVFGALAAVGALTIASFARDALFGSNAPPMPPGSVGFNPHAERDRELRKSHDFLGYVQCPVPTMTGIVQIDGVDAVTGPWDIAAGFAEFPVFAEAGEVTLRVPDHHPEVARWSALGDNSETPCAPLPVWRAFTPRHVEGHVRSPDNTPVTPAHVMACGNLVPVAPDGAFAFEGGTAACQVEPFLRRTRSSVAGVAVPYDPEAPPTDLAVVFVPRAVRLDQWQGQPADLEFLLTPEGLVVAHALAPSLGVVDGQFHFVAVPGLPQQARITAVGGEPLVGAAADRMIELAEALASAGTSYHIVRP